MNNLDKSKFKVKTEMYSNDNDKIVGTWIERDKNRNPILFSVLKDSIDYLSRRAYELNEHNKDLFRINHGLKFYYILKVIKDNKIIRKLNSKNLKNY